MGSSSPYPKVTLVAFGFQVDAHSSARQAIFRHQLAKKALFLAKNAMSGLIRSGLLWYDPFWSGVVLPGLFQSGPFLSGPVVPV